jgi:hypothetical protein
MILTRDEKPLFTLGMYERPRTDDEWREWSEAGINLVGCSSREHLDEAREWGMFGWVTVPMILKDDDDGSALVERVEELKDHPVLAVWEGPDEAIWGIWRLEKGKPPRFWERPSDLVNELLDKADALVRGLERGVRLIRERDPGRPIWLNEACQSSQSVLARCLPSLDILGFDYFPVPPNDNRQMHHLGLYTERYRQTAVAKEVWVVEQGFSWSSLKEYDEGTGYAVPNLDQYRFMAWQAMLRGATGLLWWGSSHEERPAPFMPDLMAVVREINGLQEFMHTGSIPDVVAEVDHRRAPPVLGASCIVKRVESKTLLVLINEDPTGADVMVRGLDWIQTDELEPITPVSSELTPVAGGSVTPMNGYETRIYVAG